MITRLRYAVPVAAGAGVLLALCFEPVGLQARFAGSIPIALAALFLSTRTLRVRAAWLPGLMFGVGFSYTLHWWMQAVGVDAYLSLAGLEAAFFAVLGAVIPVLGRLRWWPAWLAVGWVAVEVWRSGWPFGGMPWGRLPYATVDTPFAQALPWLGTTLVSLLMALGGALLAWAIGHAGELRTDQRARWLRRTGIVAGVYLVAIAVPTLLTYPVEDDGSAVVAAVQGNVPGDGSDILLDHRQVTRNHADATVDLAEDVASGRVPEPDFVLWPENSTAVDPFLDPGVNAEIRRAVAAIGRPVLVGGIVDSSDGQSLLNQGIVWSPRSGGGDRYTKRHPVPFGEYIPWRDKVFSSNFGNLSMISRDQLSGTRVQPLRIGGLRVADAICFDVAYDDGIYDQVGAGAQLLVVQTSNAKYIHTHQIDQQFEITRLRALETRRSVAVASPNGISGIFAPDGSIVSVAQPRTQEVLVERVPLTTTVTPAVWLGPWPGRVCVTLALAGLLWAIVAGSRIVARNSHQGEPEIQVE